MRPMNAIPHKPEAYATTRPADLRRTMFASLYLLSPASGNAQQFRARSNK
ncbi:MAG: hypothetical protein JWM11_7337 [Planctomycetaceae bacterium]|nr:hypothetical protein [Planctomycetaceae bacterium]